MRCLFMELIIKALVAIVAVAIVIGVVKLAIKFVGWLCRGIYKLIVFLALLSIVAGYVLNFI